MLVNHQSPPKIQNDVFFCFFFFFLLHFFVLLSFSFQMLNIWLRSSWLGVSATNFSDFSQPGIGFKNAAEDWVFFQLRFCREPVARDQQTSPRGLPPCWLELHESVSLGRSWVSLDGPALLPINYHRWSFFNSWVYYIILIILFRLIDFPVDRFSLRNTPHFHDVFDSVVTKSETKQAMPGCCDLANHLIRPGPFHIAMPSFKFINRFQKPQGNSTNYLSCPEARLQKTHLRQCCSHCYRHCCWCRHGACARGQGDVADSAGMRPHL